MGAEAIVYTAAEAGIVSCDNAVREVKPSITVDTAATIGDAAIADGHTIQGDRAGATAAGTNVKHAVIPTAINDRFRWPVAMDGQIAAVQDIQVADDIGIIA